MNWELLETERKALRFSRKRLAIEAGIPTNTFNSAYRRKSDRCFTAEQYKALAEVLGVRACEIAGICDCDSKERDETYAGR